MSYGGGGHDPVLGPVLEGRGWVFGGFCLPKDIQAFNQGSPTGGIVTPVLPQERRKRVQQQRCGPAVDKVNETRSALGSEGESDGLSGIALAEPDRPPPCPRKRGDPAPLLAEGGGVRRPIPKQLDTSTRACIPALQYKRGP